MTVVRPSHRTSYVRSQPPTGVTCSPSEPRQPTVPQPAAATSTSSTADPPPRSLSVDTLVSIETRPQSRYLSRPSSGVGALVVSVLAEATWGNGAWPCDVLREPAQHIETSFRCCRAASA